MPIFAFLFLFLFTSQSFAAVDSNLQIENQLNQERQSIIREQETLEHQRIKKNYQILDQEKPDKKTNLGEDLYCLSDVKIEISGNTEFSSAHLKSKFIDSYQNQCLGKAEISKIKKDVENYYLDAGYINARVYVDDKKLSEKILQLLIFEGQVNDVRFKNSTDDQNKFSEFRQQTQLFTAFPLLKNKVFNLRDFEQGLDQINRLQSNSAKIDSVPAAQDGYSDVVIDNVVGNKTNIALNYDNGGQASTGKYRKKIALNQDNILALNDSLYFSYTQDAVPHQSQKYNKSYYAALSIPLGYWTLQNSYSQSQYLLTSQGLVSNQEISGGTDIRDFQLDRVIFRGKSYKYKLGGDLSLKNVTSFNSGVKTSVGNRKTSSASIFSEGLFFLSNATLFIKPSYVVGTNWFDATKDSRAITTTSAHNQYELAKFYSYYNTNFIIPKIQLPLNYNLSFDSQFSADTLNGSEQFNIGGQYSVRGFDENNMGGDNGYTFRNDLRVRVADLIPNKLLASDKFNLANIASKSSITLFYDYGYVRQKVTFAGGEGFMSGAGVKLSFSGQYFETDLTYSKGLHSPKSIQNDQSIPKDGETIYLNFGLKFGAF